MKKVLGLYLAVSLTVGTALSQNVPSTPEPTLEKGISQYNEGDMAGAVFTLETVIRNLAVEPALHTKELSQAYLYRGAGFVRLSQEENAKGSFAAAIQYDKGLRISEDKFSPRVVRVFEAARTGKTKSVLLPPSNVTKKAGIGALGIAGIVAGVAAIGGGVVAATHGSSNPPVSQAAITVSFLGGTPAPGATITVGQPSNSKPIQLSLSFSLSSPSATTGTLLSTIRKDNTACLYGGPAAGFGVGNGGIPFSVAAGQTLTLTAQYYYLGPSPACAFPVTTNRVVVQIPEIAGYASGFENVTYSLVQ